MLSPPRRTPALCKPSSPTWPARAPPRRPAPSHPRPPHSRSPQPSTHKLLHRWRDRQRLPTSRSSEKPHARRLPSATRTAWRAYVREGCYHRPARSASAPPGPANRVLAALSGPTLAAGFPTSARGPAGPGPGDPGAPRSGAPASWREQSGEVRGRYDLPRCDTVNSVGRRFCAECGSSLALACPPCGFSNEPGVKFCGGCGAALGTSPAAAGPRFAAFEPFTPKHLAEKILTSKAALEGERKQVTVLFADLKGSMELLADRDPEEARKLLVLCRPRQRAGSAPPGPGAGPGRARSGRRGGRRARRRQVRLYWEFTHSHRAHGRLLLESGSVSYGKATRPWPR